MHIKIPNQLKGEAMHAVNICVLLVGESRLVPRCPAQGSGAAAMPA